MREKTHRFRVCMEVSLFQSGLRTVHFMRLQTCGLPTPITYATRSNKHSVMDPFPGRQQARMERLSGIGPFIGTLLAKEKSRPWRNRQIIEIAGLRIFAPQACGPAKDQALLVWRPGQAPEIIGVHKRRQMVVDADRLIRIPEDQFIEGIGLNGSDDGEGAVIRGPGCTAYPGEIVPGKFTQDCNIFPAVRKDRRPVLLSLYKFGTMIGQEERAFQISCCRCLQECGSAGVISGIDGGSMLEQDSDARETAICRGDDESGLSCIISGVDIGSSCQQKANNVRIFSQCRIQ